MLLPRRRMLALLLAGPWLARETVPARAQDPIALLLDRLTGDPQSRLQAWKDARARFDAELTAYWEQVSTRRTERRRKIRAGQAATADDYVSVFPPEYTGPKLTPELQALLAEEEKKEPPKPPPEPLPVVADFLAHAKTVYGFEPERIPEPEFKRRYARESLAHGLTKEQVVRVYIFETGGNGTADMQAGINPQTRQGRAISSALGYAQLLNANSVNEIVKHGEAFIQRLSRMAAAPGTPPARVTSLRAKQQVLRKMLTRARSVPNEWANHMRFANTPDGLGIHALNLDGDIGPWLQSAKLNDIRKYAIGEGRPVLTAAELELMNLAGPSTGIEMMTPVGAAMPTPNFFSRGGYERNSIVRGRTAAELLLEIDRRMDAWQRQPGAVEFARIFDEVAREPR